MLCCLSIALAWWRHQMETFSALLAICAGNSPVPGEFPTQRPVTWSFDVYFDLRPNKQLSKQWRGWWFETPSWSLWRHRNGIRSGGTRQLERGGDGTWDLIVSFGTLNDLYSWGPFYLHWLTPAWINNHIPSEIWYEITYAFSNFIGFPVEVWKWISDFLLYFVI